STEMPLAVVAIITFSVGVISMGLYGMTVFFRLKKRIRSLTKEAKANEKELNSLRNLPVTTEVVGAEQTSDM
ncbi:MAG: LapA family protein, partial [Deltaproteobacteria bacterium]|nr:LapA family protein [Deltaproteobacteria bacterium]